jgi:uncharacterized protein (DUF433 family)
MQPARQQLSYPPRAAQFVQLAQAAARCPERRDVVIPAHWLSVPALPLIDRLWVPGRVINMANSIVSTAPDIMGGTPVFPGTRVPVQTLLDYLGAGDTIDDFLEGFPSVSREQVIAFLERGAAVTEAA